MIEFAQLGWAYFAALMVLLCGAIALGLLILREYYQSRKIRRGFKLTLARFSAWDWMRNIRGRRAKRLTYRPDIDD